MFSKWKQAWTPPERPAPPSTSTISAHAAVTPATSTPAASNDQFIQQHWQPDANYYDCNRVQGQAMPRTTSSKWRMSQAPLLNLVGRDPLELRLVECFRKGADEWPFRLFANGGAVGINIIRNLSDRSWNIETGSNAQ